MPYRKESFAENELYHIILRRLDNQALFKNDRDHVRLLFSALLINRINSPQPKNISEWSTERMRRALKTVETLPKEWLERKRENPLVRICLFNLMKTHCHFLLEQIGPGGVQEFIQRLGDSYGKYFNIKYERKGPVFETPFKAVPISDDRQLRYVVGYITLNALDVAGIKWRKVTMKAPWQKAKEILDAQPWSSYHYYMGKSDFDALVDGGVVKEMFPNQDKFDKHILGWGLEKWSLEEVS